MYSVASVPNVTVGIDVGDKQSEICEVDASGEVITRCAVATTEVGIWGYFGKRSPCRVVLEAGTHSPWIDRLLRKSHHEVLVANPSKLYVRGRRKNDHHDAELLARLGRTDVQLLWPVRHRSAQVQRDLEVIRARDQLVGARTKLICHVRGAVKSFGGRLGDCSSEAFARSVVSQLPADLRLVLTPLLKSIRVLTHEIAVMDRRLG